MRDHALADRIGIWSAVGCWDAPDLHDCVQPGIERAAVACFRLESTKDPVVVMNQEARPIPRTRIADLLFHPLQGGMSSDTDLHEFARAVVDDHEDGAH